MRTFIAIDIPEEARKQIEKIQNQLPEFKGKLTEKENLHLTLKFLGEIDWEKAEQVKKKLKEINFEKFETEIDALGVFSEKFVKIVWLHLKNCDELQKEIDNKLEDLFAKEQRFMSHLTIARVKSLKDKEKFLEELRKIEISKIKFVVDSFKFKKSVLMSEGPVYEDIEIYDLN